MKKITIITVLFLCSIFIHAQKKAKIKGNKIVTEVSKDILESFNAIEIDDNLKVNLRQGDQNSYFLMADENLIDVIQFTVKDSILKVYTSSKIVSRKKLELTLQLRK